jgi:hypothetical protein
MFSETPIDPKEFKKKQLMYHFSKIRKKYYAGYSHNVGDINYSNANRFKGKENLFIIKNKFLLNKKRKLTKATVVDIKTNDTTTIPQTKYKRQQSKAEIRREVESEIQQQLKEVEAAKTKAVLVFVGVGFVSLFFTRDVVWGVGILVYLGIWALYAVAYGWKYFYNHTDR